MESLRKVLVTGANGQLGKDMVEVLLQRGYECIGCGRNQLDITDMEMVKEVVQSIRPDVIIHAAAYTKVDVAESEPEKAFLVNAWGTRNMSVAAESIGAKLVYISTDYVFNGNATMPYQEFSPTAPINVYGASKLAGEQMVRDFHTRFFIVRTSWVYGRYGQNFVKTMLDLAKKNQTLKVVHDQIGSPTYTVDLAKKIEELIRTDRYGIYHISNSGQCSWYKFAKSIFKIAEIEVDVQPVATSDFPRPAKRPAYSVLDHMALRLNGFSPMRKWEEALHEFIGDYY
ncbi:dTDP-4-dehydrorhamnose reductase [Bacillaceae bacterium]